MNVSARFNSSWDETSPLDALSQITPDLLCAQIRWQGEVLYPQRDVRTSKARYFRISDGHASHRHLLDARDGGRGSRNGIILVQYTRSRVFKDPLELLLNDRIGYILLLFSSSFSKSHIRGLASSPDLNHAIPILGSKCRTPLFFLAPNSPNDPSGSRPNYSLEYAGGAYTRPVALDFETIPDYPHDRDQWMSSQIQFHIPNTVEPVSPFSMSSALPHLKQSSQNSSLDSKSVAESDRQSTSTNQADLSYVVPATSDSQFTYTRGYASRRSSSHLGLPTIPELSWAESVRLSELEADNGHSFPGSHAHSPLSGEEDESLTHSNPTPMLMGGPGSNSSTHSGLTSDSAPRTPPLEAQKDYFSTASVSAQLPDRPDGYSHEAYPAAPHSYISSPSTPYLRDSWSQFMLDAQSHYISASGSVHGTEMRSNRPPSAIEEKGEKWTGEVPNVWSLFSASPTSGVLHLPPTPPVPALPQKLIVNPIFAHILWDIRFPPASASLITAKYRNGAKSRSELWHDSEGATRALSKVEHVAHLVPTHTMARAGYGESATPDEPPTYVSVADVLFALHEQLVLRFVKQNEWEKLDERTRWYISRAYGKNRVADSSDAGSFASRFSGSVGDGTSMRGSVWSEGSRMSDVLRERTLFAGIRSDPAYKRRTPEDGLTHLVMDLRRHERPASMASA
ncbi:hypothetical protein RhiXN_01716 [Rhizoctonia solani]|uniref:DUF6699 domain-containing protein n=1 Tax=Rhizoctonia solani TaxID=456999 RepID=A0A8H8P7Q5_9AGAM|nr:uncharacterized protein RhiXN_01716 [Rhizoctonia solani]QRW27121.1 hypothetical protein RhiXN_01716 [Rhizoctonia solani]